MAALLLSLPGWGCDLDLSNGYGPWDYYDPRSHKPTGADPMGAIKRVTNRHMNTNMLTLTKGATGAPIYWDLDYTLRAIPNHPVALNLASRLEQAIRLNPTRYRRERMPKTADCYFERAIRFTPQYGPIYMLFGLHKQRNHDYLAAIKNYRRSMELGYETVEMHYNLGLAYYEVEDYEKARQEAVLAYDAGYPLDGLKNLLKAVSVDIEAAQAQ